MRLARYHQCLVACSLAAILSPKNGCTETLRWNVDPAASYIRLTIPDQTLTMPDLGEVTFRVRDSGNNSQWTDSEGRRAALDGEIVTEYVDGESISFTSGSHSLIALEQVSLRPNPAAWDTPTESYTDTSAAPAALGGKIRATYVILSFDVAFLAFRNVRIDIGNATPGTLAIVEGAFPTDATVCGIAGASVDADGLELPLGLGQPVPDVRDGQLPLVMQPNAGGGMITDLGDQNRKLTYTIKMSDLAFDLEGATIIGSAEGQIVAYATLSEPPPEPPLLDARKQADKVVLSWPATAQGFASEYAVSLPAVTWTPLPTLPVIIGDRYVVTNTPSAAAVFYRLKWAR